MVPPEMVDYLSTKVEEYGTYEDTKELVPRFVETTPGRGRAPMDVGRVEIPGSLEEAL